MPALEPPDPAVLARARRQAVMLLALVNALVLAVGLVTTVDLRRLHTPGGTALRWVQSAVFGDCGDYLEFSLPDEDAPDPRSAEDTCRDLRAATADARNHSATIGLRLDGVTRRGHDDATAAVTLTRDGRAEHLQVHVVRLTGSWRVLRDIATCASVGCA